MKKEDVDYIMSVLRRGTVKWIGRRRVLRRFRKKVLVRYSKKDNKPIFKFHWQCAVCREWYENEKMLEVDHVVEIGGFKGDWNDIIKRMYPEDLFKALQILCIVCHKKKTQAYNNARLRWKRKPKT